MIKINNLSQIEIVKYVSSFDSMSSQDVSANELTWKLGILTVDELIQNEQDSISKNEWLKWIEEEQKGRLEEWGYDSIKEIEEYWLADPKHEPIIIALLDNGKFEIWDGYHRLGIAIKNNLNDVPVIIGTN